MATYVHYVSALVALALAFILLIAGAGAMSAQVSDAERHYQRTDQQLDVRNGSSWENASQLALEDAEINYVYDNETISHDGKTLQEVKHYRLNQSSAKVKWLSDPDLDPNKTASATFHARGHPKSAAVIIDITEAVVPVLPWVLLVVVAFAIVALLVGVTFIFGLGADFGSRGGMGR